MHEWLPFRGDRTLVRYVAAVKEINSIFKVITLLQNGNDQVQPGEIDPVPSDDGGEWVVPATEKFIIDWKFIVKRTVGFLELIKMCSVHIFYMLFAWKLGCLPSKCNIHSDKIVVSGSCLWKDSFQ